jgi:hypothetical protein
LFAHLNAAVTVFWLMVNGTERSVSLRLGPAFRAGLFLMPPPALLNSHRLRFAGRRAYMPGIDAKLRRAVRMQISY